MVTKIITRIRRISSVKRSSAAEDSNRGDDEDNNKRNNTQGDNSNNDDKYHRNEGEENQHAKKLKGCQNKATDGGMICDNGHSYHDVFFRCKPNDNTTAEDDGKAAAFRQHTADTTCKKLPLLLDDADDDEAAKCQKGKQMCIDLTDVPLKLPTKNNKKGASSKYQGVYFDYSRNKWMAKSMIDGKQHHIGNYENEEEEAAVDYARPLFEYEAGKVNARGNTGQKFVDLTDVPPQLPIISNKKGASSRYQGVCFDKRRNKWKATISLDGKTHSIAEHATEEEAAVDYARALFKYGSRRKRKFIDLTDVPSQPPILNNHDRYETSKYQGVHFKTARNKWNATISLNGKLYGIGTYDTEEEAAVDFARAKFKYVQNSSTMVESHTDKESNGET